MCFSATASFTVAGIIAATGAAILYKPRASGETALAVFPLLFAIQQSIEGLLWLSLSGTNTDSPQIRLLSTLFIIFAEIIWPVLTPAAVLMSEPERTRRAILRFLAALGLMVAGYLLYAALASPFSADIRNHNIHYFNDFSYLLPYRLFYVIAVSGPLLLSSWRTLQTFGVLVFLGYVISLYGYSGGLISVWCFFAAAASGTLYFHFHRPRAV